MIVQIVNPLDQRNLYIFTRLKESYYVNQYDNMSNYFNHFSYTTRERFVIITKGEY